VFSEESPTGVSSGLSESNRSKGRRNGPCLPIGSELQDHPCFGGVMWPGLVAYGSLERKGGSNGPMDNESRVLHGTGEKRTESLERIRAAAARSSVDGH
jgi:hypothetical protein